MSALQMGLAAPKIQHSSNPLQTCTQPHRCKCPGTTCSATMTTVMGLPRKMPCRVIAHPQIRAVTSALSTRSAGLLMRINQCTCIGTQVQARFAQSHRLLQQFCYTPPPQTPFPPHAHPRLLAMDLITWLTECKARFTSNVHNVH